MTNTDGAPSTESLRAILKSQYHASLAMLREAIDRCPDDLWTSTEHLNPSWEVAYHVLFFAHVYSSRDEASFRPWEHHQADVQYPDGIPGPADPKSTLPLVATPYTKSEVLAYWTWCDGWIDAAIDAMDLASPQSGFSNYPIPKLEHQLVNIRHIQHHTAQLAARLRTTANIGIDWVGARRAKTTGGPG